MVNQQLVDFIKSELSKGVDRETIKKQLMGSGWNEEDVEEGFGMANAKVINLTNAPVAPISVETFNKGKKITYTIVSTIFTILVATGLIFGDEISVLKDSLIQSIKGSKTEIINQIKQEENIKPNVQEEINLLEQNSIEKSNEISNLTTQKKDIISTTKTPTSLKSTENQNSNCEQIVDKRKQLDCIIKQVSQSGDIKICSLLDKLSYVDNNEKQIYKDTCYVSSVNITKNIATCDILVNKDIKDACYNQIASITKDIKTCGIIKDARMQEECYQKTIYTNKDINSCELLNRLDFKDKCYSDTAINIKNFEICNLISKPYDKFVCLSQVDISKVTNSLCSSLSNEYFANQSERGFCYSSVAHYKKDPDICKNITNDDEYNGCLYDFIRYESLYDIKICSMFRSDDDSSTKNSCIRDIAANTKDKLLCETQVFDDEYDQIEIKAIIDGCKDRIK